MIKVLLAAGPLDIKTSYEYYNFLKPMENMGCMVVPFDFVEKTNSLGREGMNRELTSTVLQEKPDVVFFVPHTDEFLPEVVDEIGKSTPTLGYFFDDMWRVEYSRFWAKHYKFVTTSDVNGVQKFREDGFENVIYSPFSCNTNVYRKKDLPKIYDVAFVGQYHPQREWYIKQLRKAGVDVKVWGKGWNTGLIGTEEMIDIFNQSRINLNLSNCVSWDLRYLLMPAHPIKYTFRAWSRAAYSLIHRDTKTVEQVKGRHFELNACGAFQVSYYVEGLERLYSIGEDLAVFVSPEDLIEKVRYYLKYPEEREAIATRGYARTLRDHTMENRLTDIFRHMRLA